MSAAVFPSQAGRDDGVPLRYTASPLRLLRSDILLGLRCLWALPKVFLPLAPWRSGKLDELYPSLENIFCLAVHGFLVVFQLGFLFSLPLCVIWMLPAVWIMAYAAVVLLVNHAICRFALNGPKRFLVSKVLDPNPAHRRENWIFVNGMAIGHHWMQSEVNRLAYTFRREITGVHNTTTGVVFDTIESIIQRCFNYATQDTRDAYPLVKQALLSPDYDKVVLILHSQGAIEGGQIIDWLLDEVPQEVLHNLEVYTFASVANHFNNPRRSLRSGQADARCIPYIEHYANSEDFVSLLGVLSFASVPNRYMGRLFVRQGSGHLLNQHYLDTMFTLGPNRTVLDHNEFMDSTVNADLLLEEDSGGLSNRLSNNADGPGSSCKPVQVKDVSRLWEYRNGRVPG